MLTCNMCGREIDPEKEKLGHVDDHIVVCQTCFPVFVKKMLKESIIGIGNHLSRWYRNQKRAGLTI